MPVGMLLDTPEGSQDMYEALTTKVFGSLQPAVLPDELIVHAAGPRDEGGWRVVDIWESADAFSFFDASSCPLVGSSARIRRRPGRRSSPSTMIGLGMSASRARKRAPAAERFARGGG